MKLIGAPRPGVCDLCGHAVVRSVRHPPKNGWQNGPSEPLPEPQGLADLPVTLPDRLRRSPHEEFHGRVRPHEILSRSLK